MQSHVMSIDLCFRGLDSCCDCLSVAPEGSHAISGRTAHLDDLIAQRTHNPFPVTIDVHHCEQTLAEPFGFKPFLDDFDCSLLLADYENLLASSNRVRNQIDDSLALARSGRPLDEKAGRHACPYDGRVLRGVTIDNVEPIYLSTQREGSDGRSV